MEPILRGMASWAGRSVGRVLLAVVLVVGGCGGILRPTTPIDGFPVGNRMGCPDGCRDVVALARTALEARSPGHPGVVGASVHFEGNGVVRSGFYGIVVFELADDTVTAIGVSCAGVNPCTPEPTYRPMATPS